MCADNVREEQLVRLMTLYKNDIMRMSVAFLKDVSLAEDAVQETFIKAYKALSTFRGESSEKTWLMKIAVNTCRDMRRDRWFRFVDRSVTPDVLPLQAASNVDRELVEIIMSLPYKLREVVLLYYYQGMSLNEIAHSLDVADSTVSIRLKKARERLRRELEGGQANV